MSINLSIIIATYNSDKTLEKTLQSLVSQTYQNFEVILIDGLSTDTTVNIIKNFEKTFLEKNISYFWISEKDTGIYDAWNKGLKQVNSSWIAFLGSDDTYYPDALEIYSTEINKNSNKNYICSKVEYIHTDGKILKILGKPYSYKQMIRYMDIAHVGSFHHKELFEKYGDFNTSYKIVGDYDFFMKCGTNIKAAFIDKITARMLNIGISNNNVKKVLNEVVAIQLQHKKTSFFQIYFEHYFALLRILKSKSESYMKNRIFKR